MLTSRCPPCCSPHSFPTPASRHRGKKVIVFWSTSVTTDLHALLQPGLRTDYTATLHETSSAAAAAPLGDDSSRVRSDAELAAIAALLRATGYDIAAVVAASELGVECADQVAAHMGLRGNGTALTDCRRDKFLMGEAVRAAGIRAVKQRLCATWAEARAFLLECGIPDGKRLSVEELALQRAIDGPAEASAALRMVIKPARSAGSDDVFLCSHMDEFEEKFKHIIGKKVPYTYRKQKHSYKKRGDFHKKTSRNVFFFFLFFFLYHC